MPSAVEYAELGDPLYFTLVALGWTEVHTLWAKNDKGVFCTFVKFTPPAKTLTCDYDGVNTENLPDA